MRFSAGSRVLRGESAGSFPGEADLDCCADRRGGSERLGAANFVRQVFLRRPGKFSCLRNRTGGSGSRAAQEVARAAPDGYVLLAGTPTTLSINPHTIKPARYDPEKDFAPITQLVTTNFFFLVRADFPANTLGELRALARRVSGKLSFGSSGPGSITHLIMAMFGASASIDFLHVPYRSTTLAINDLIAGQIDTAVGPIDAVMAFVKTGKLKVLAAASAKRTATMPEVPTFGEEGYPAVVASLWMGLLAPARTPQPIIDGLHSAMAQALQAREVKERLRAPGRSSSAVRRRSLPNSCARTESDGAQRFWHLGSRPQLIDRPPFASAAIGRICRTLAALDRKLYYYSHPARQL